MKMGRSASTWCARRASSDEFPPAQCVHWHDTPRADSRLAQTGSCYLRGRGTDMRQSAWTRTRGRWIWFLMGLVLMIAAVPAQAQKKDKNKNKNVPASTSGDDIKSAMHMPDAQAVDQTIGEFLGYWQIG